MQQLSQFITMEFYYKWICFISWEMYSISQLSDVQTGGILKDLGDFIWARFI